VIKQKVFCLGDLFYLRFWQDLCHRDLVSKFWKLNFIVLIIKFDSNEKDLSSGDDVFRLF
jgi:hypothetical protein